MLLAVSRFEAVFIVRFAAFLAVLIVAGVVRGGRRGGSTPTGCSSGFQDGRATWFTHFGCHDGGGHSYHPFDGGQDAGGATGGFDGGSSGDCGGSDGGGGGCGGE